MRDVVVREEHVVGLVRHGKVESGLEGARGPRVLAERDHASLAEGLGEQLAGAVGGRAVDRHDREARVRLIGEGGKALAEPSDRVADDEDDEDGGRALGDGGGGR